MGDDDVRHGSGFEAPENLGAEEQREVHDVVARVGARFPDVSSEQVRELVLSELQAHEDAAVRDFVPVLAENAVMDHLRAVAEPASVCPVANPWIE